MNEQSPQSMPQPGKPMSWIQTWIAAVRNPREQTYTMIADAPGASAGKAYLWVALVAAISTILNILFQAGSGSNPSGWLCCFIPAAPVGAILGLMIQAGIVRFTIKSFRAPVSFQKIAYVFGAIATPVSLAAGILALFYLGDNTRVIAFLMGIPLGLYALFLQILAVKAMARLSWGKAVAAALSPAILGIILIGMLVVVLLLLGPVVQRNFQMINSQLVK